METKRFTVGDLTALLAKLNAPDAVLTVDVDGVERRVSGYIHNIGLTFEGESRHFGLIAGEWTFGKRE